MTCESVITAKFISAGSRSLAGFVRQTLLPGARARGFTLPPGRRLNKDRSTPRSRLFEAKSPESVRVLAIVFRTALERTPQYLR